MDDESRLVDALCIALAASGRVLTAAELERILLHADIELGAHSVSGRIRLIKRVAASEAAHQRGIIAVHGRLSPSGAGRPSQAGYLLTDEKRASSPSTAVSSPAYAAATTGTTGASDPD